jgi:predicted RNA-binding protein YlxR (DUF448 family)
VAFPIRTCVGCRQRLPAAELLRLAVDAEGRVAVGRTLAGRGAWICHNVSCAERADRSAGVARTLRVNRDSVDIGCAQAALIRWNVTGAETVRAPGVR